MGDYMMDSDTFLVQRTLEFKDERAFARLMSRHSLMVRRMVIRFCAGDRHAVEDLMQETFMRAFIALASFRAEAKFSTWLCRIALNVAADSCRRKTMNYCDLDGILDIADESSELYHLELRDDLVKAMQSISSAQKKVIHLCLGEGYTHMDAASLTGIPLGTVKTHVARGKASLQKALAHWGEAI